MRRSTERQAEFSKRPAAGKFTFVRGLLAAGVLLLSVGLGLPVRQPVPEIGAGTDAASRAVAPSGVEHRLAGAQTTTKPAALAQRDRDSDKGPGRSIPPVSWAGVPGFEQGGGEACAPWHSSEIAPACRLWRAGYARAPPSDSDLTRTPA